ncbi:MAG: M81 family metallopeptidase, partial [Pirellulales bacterium]
MSKEYHVAVGGLVIECNHLGGVPADMAAFEDDELRRGAELFDNTEGVTGGMIHTLRRRGVCIQPLLLATCCSRGPVTTDCYRRLKGELLERLGSSMPLEGVLVALHGAAAAEDTGDLDGDLLEAIRERVGPDVPVVGSLDLHADVTEKMVRNADALLAWETYPHADTYETGVRAARLLCGILDGKCRPTMAMGKVPLLIGAVHGGTEGEGPFAEVMRYAKSLEQRPEILSTSALLVHPYIDVPHMGGGGLVITNDHLQQAEEFAREIADRYWRRRHDLEPEVHSPQQAIQLGESIEGGPVLLVETADCCGGGAAGDSVASLKALLESRTRCSALIPVVDPEAAAACHIAGVSQEVTLELGHKIDPKWGKPIGVSGTVLKLTDGQFRYNGGVWVGQQASMGLSALLQIGALRVLITSRATYDWDDEQFRSVGVDPQEFKFIVAKNPMNYRTAYGDVARAVFILDTPGPTPATVRHVQYRHMQRPYFPLDKDIAGLRPSIFTH